MSKQLSVQKIFTRWMANKSLNQTKILTHPASFNKEIKALTVKKVKRPSKRIEFIQVHSKYKGQKIRK